MLHHAKEQNSTPCIYILYRTSPYYITLHYITSQHDIRPHYLTHHTTPLHYTQAEAAVAKAEAEARVMADPWTQDQQVPHTRSPPLTRTHPTKHTNNPPFL